MISHKEPQDTPTQTFGSPQPVPARILQGGKGCKKGPKSNFPAIMLSHMKFLVAIFLFLILTAGFINPVFTATSPRFDIVQIGLTADKSDVQVGEDVTFTITLKNVSRKNKNVEAACFDSNDGNFGCQNDFNIPAGESFTFSNSGRWVSGGIKSVWVTWSPDNNNYYRPLYSSRVIVTVAE